MLVIVSACLFCYPNRGFSGDLVSQTLLVHSSGFIDSYNFRWVVHFLRFPKCVDPFESLYEGGPKR